MASIHLLQRANAPLESIHVAKDRIHVMAVFLCIVDEAVNAPIQLPDVPHNVPHEALAATGRPEE